MALQEKITKRFEELLEEGKQLTGKFSTDLAVGMPGQEIPTYQSWISSVANLFHIIVPEKNPLNEELRKHLGTTPGLAPLVVLRIYGLLLSAKNEWDSGLLSKVEYVVVAVTFDDFLDHANVYHRGGMKNEAAVLAGAVLEDTIKKIASKNSVPSNNLTLDPLIDDLVRAGVFTPLQAKQNKVLATIRNYALHAEWTKFDIRAAGDLINGTRQLIKDFL